MKDNFLTFKDPRRESALFKRRLLFVIVIIILLISGLLARLAYLQLYEHKIYTTLARQNQMNLMPLEPNRGLIYDRNGVLLAENIPVFDLVITPSAVPNLEDTVKNLQKLIPISDDDLRQFYRAVKLHRHFQPAIIRSKLTEEEVARFSVEQYHFPGVAIVAEMIRHYPLGPTFAQVIGYEGRISAKELESVDPTNYSVTNFIGKIGIEKFYETLLHGSVGNQQVESDATGQIIRVIDRTPPVGGSNLYLTIDSKLQMAAEQALAGQRGAIVAIDPRNGEVLALVSEPSYDPNLFAAGIDKDTFKELQTGEGQPLFNRAIHGKYPPGSTIKPFIALGGLSNGVIDKNFSIHDPGWFKLNDSTHIYHDDARWGHGTVNVAKAVMVSCDTFFYTLAVKLGILQLDDILQRFGFGKVTGIDLYGESSGNIPSPAWKLHAMGKSWYPGDTVISGIGQGFMQVTPLQMAVGAATLAAHGQRWLPHLLYRVQSPQGNMETINPVALTPVAIDKEHWQLILDAMESVADDPSGTAYRYFQGASYTVAAKTGTAQVFSLKNNEKDKAQLLPEYLRDNSLFIVFAPVDEPRIALAVMIQNSSIPAAQIARTVLDYYFSPISKQPPLDASGGENGGGNLLNRAGGAVDGRNAFSQK